MGKVFDCFTFGGGCLFLLTLPLYLFYLWRGKTQKAKEIASVCYIVGFLLFAVIWFVLFITTKIIGISMPNNEIYYLSGELITIVVVPVVITLGMSLLSLAALLPDLLFVRINKQGKISCQVPDTYINFQTIGFGSLAIVAIATFWFYLATYYVHGLWAAYSLL